MASQEESFREICIYNVMAPFTHVSNSRAHVHQGLRNSWHCARERGQCTAKTYIWKWLAWAIGATDIFPEENKPAKSVSDFIYFEFGTNCRTKVEAK